MAATPFRFGTEFAGKAAESESRNKMETFIAIAAILLGLLGLVGSVVPGIAGPPFSWAGLLVLYIWGSGTNSSGDPLSLTILLVWLGITIFLWIMDYVVPGYFTKLTGGSKYGGWGATIGLFLGLIYPPVGMILGALGGAFIGELVFARKDPATSVKAAFGAFLGFLASTGAKLIACAVMMFYIVIYAF